MKHKTVASIEVNIGLTKRIFFCLSDPIAYNKAVKRGTAKIQPSAVLESENVIYHM